MNHTQLIDDLLNELSYRVGIVDLKNKNQQSIISEILSEWGEYDAKKIIMEFLTEAGKTPDMNRPKADTEGDDKDYVHKGAGIYVRKGDEDKETAQKYKKDDGGSLRAISDDEANKIKNSQGEKGKQAAANTPQNQQGGDAQQVEEPSKGTSLKQGGYDKVVDKEEETRKQIAAEKEGTPEKVSPKSEPNVLEKTKNKKLGKLNTEVYDKNINPSDDEYELSNPIQNSDTPTRLPDGIFGTPSKVPKKYEKLMERLINARYIDSTTPPMTSMVDGSGAGKIQAQAGEVMSMVFSSLDDAEFEELVNIIREHNSKNEIKKNDGSSYSPPRYPKENQPILSEDWVKSSIAVRAGIRQRYDAEFGKGNWEVENGAWDLKDEVEAMGLSDYPNNKGFSTDMYLRVKNKKTGESILDEVSLKKDLNIFLSQPSVSAVYTWSFSNEERDEFDKLTQRRAELASNGENKRGDGKKEDAKLLKRQKELLELGNSRVPKSANPKEFNKNTTESATNFYNGLSLQQITLLNSIDDSPEGIAKLAKELNQDKKYTANFVKVLKSLTNPVNRDELRQKMIDAGFKPGKTTNMYLDKFAVMTMRAGKMLGDETSTKELEKHLQIGKDFNKAFVENMVEEPYKSGMMNTVREKFPLKALMEGEEKMSLGGVVADPIILKSIFGTDNYDEIEENLTIEGPDDNGEYQLVFEVEAGGEKIPLSTVAPRQRGLGYEPAVNLEMNLHPSMKEKLYCANVKNGREFPEKEEYAKKYTCS